MIVKRLGQPGGQKTDLDSRDFSIYHHPPHPVTNSPHPCCHLLTCLPSSLPFERHPKENFEPPDVMLLGDPGASDMGVMSIPWHPYLSYDGSVSANIEGSEVGQGRGIL